MKSKKDRRNSSCAFFLVGKFELVHGDLFEDDAADMKKMQFKMPQKKGLPAIIFKDMFLTR